MKKFKIECLHEVFEDSYENGEGDYVNSYETDAVIKAETWQDAVKDFYENTLYYNFDIDSIDINDDGESFFESCIVDAENTEPSEYQLERWKNGDMILYTNRMTVYVYEIVAVTLD